MYEGYSRRSNMQRELERVAIVSVDPASRTATGITRIRTSLTINCAYATGDTVTTPAVGEQWYVERMDMEWRLYGRIPFNDATLNIEPEEGQVLVGSASGPLELNGTEIRANGASFRLNGAYYRDDGATLLRSTDGDLWEPIFANATGNGTAGVLQMLAHRLADIPVTPEVTEYLEELSDAEAAALTDLAQWADGLQETIGGGWDALCNNPFFANLRQLGDGDSPLDEVVTGLQNFLNDLTRLLFCQFEGDVTPQALTGAFGGLQEVFTGDNPTGDFLRGLQGLLPIGDQANNLLLDSVNGAVKFVQDLFDILFCTDAAVPIDPTEILGQLSTIFDPLKSNPFLLGLQQVFTDAGNAATNLFTDSIEGTVKIIQDLFGAVFCGVDLGDEPLTPQTLFEKLNEGIIEPLRDNPFIQALTDLAERMGIEFNNNLTGAISGAVEFLQLAIGVVTCNLTPAQVTKVDDFIETATGGLLPADIFDFLQNKLIKPLNNSFVQGLAEMFRATNNLNRSLLEDAIAGAEQLIEVIQDIVTCNVDGTLIGNIKALVGPDAIGVTPAKLVKLLDDFFGTFRSNSFVTGLQTFWTTLGNQASTAAQDAVLGAQRFFEFVTNLLLCKPVNPADLTALRGAAGSSFTPAKIVKDVDDFFEGFRQNPFLKGLQDFWTTLGNNAENFLQDAISGASRFVEFLFDLVTCQLEDGQLEDVLGLANVETGLTPSRLIKNIEDFFDGFRSNPFVTGLQGIWTSLGNTTHGLLRDVADGVTEFFKVIFGALNCDFTQLSRLNTLAGSAAASGSTPVGILATLKQTFLGADGTGGLLGNNWVQIFNGVANRQGFGGNLLNKITDGFSAVADFFFDILDNLFPSIDFRTIITEFPNGFPTALPTLQDWLEDLDLGKLLDPLNLGGWFRDNIFKPILKAITGLDDGVLDSMLDPKTAIATFFTNVRKFFGEGLIGNWLDSFGGGLLSGNFNPITALQTFISDVLVEGIDNLWDALVDGLTNASNLLVKALTGQPIGGVIGDGLKAIKDFFGGFAGFNPVTGENSLISQIVKEIVGEDGQFTLEDLGRFFSFTGDNTFANIFKLITDAITNGATSFLTGPLKALADFFNPTNSGNIFKNLVDVITGAVTNFTTGLTTGPLKVLFDFFDPNKTTNVFKNLVDAIVNHSTTFLNGPLKALADFFDFDKTSSLLNTIVETMIGSNVLSGSGPLAKLSQLFSGVNLVGGKSLITQVIDQVNYIAEVLGLDSIVANITGVNVTELENSYTLTFGGSPTGGTFTLVYGGQTTAAITYSTTTSTTSANIKTALDALTNIDDSIATFSGGKYTVALNNTAGTLTLGTAALTGGTSPTLTVAQKFRGSLDVLGQFFTGLNPFTGSSGTNLLQQILTQAGSNIAEFVSKITGIDVEDLLNPLAAVEKFFDGLADVFNPVTGENNLISQIVKRIIPNGSNLFDLGTFFDNIRGLFGLTGTGPLADILSGDFLSIPSKLADAASRFVNSFLSKAGTGTITNFAKIPATILSNLGLGQIDDLVKLITGIDPATGQHANVLQTFFAGLSGINANIVRNANSLVSQIANAITGKTGGNPLSDIRTFFGIGTGGLLDFSGNNTIPVINQIVRAITGKSGTSHPLADIAAFLGIGPTTDPTTLNPFTGTNNLIKQVIEKIVPVGSGLDQLKSFFDNLRDLFGLGDASGFLGTLTGGNLGDIGANFINNVLSKAGTGTLSLSAISKIPGNLLAIGISNVENLISTLTGGTSTTQLANFFANLRKFLNIGTTGTDVVNFFADPNTFSIPNAINGFIKNILNAATEIGRIPARLIEAFSPSKITGLIEALTGKTVGAVDPDLNTFFTNLRRTLNLGTGTGQINLLDPTATLGALQTNFFNFVSNLTTGINSFLTQAGLNNWLGGGLNLTEIGNWFSNLVKFFKVGEFKLAPGVFDVGIAAGNFIKDIINQATGFLISPLKVLGVNTGNLSDDLGARPLLTTLLGWITGTGTVNAFDTFFTNIKSFFGNGINLLGTTFNANTAQQTLTNIIKNANDTVEAFISKSGLQSWLGAVNLGEIGNFFQNLVKFFKIGEFKLAPGTFNIGIAAGNFINDVINQATNFLISPLKVLGIGGSNLSTDLSARPILTDLRTWLTTANASATEDIQKFFTNLRTTLGINFLPAGGVFNAGDAQKVIHDVIANVNNSLSAGQKWVTQLVANGKAEIADIVKKITGIDNAQSLDPLGTFFGSFTSQATTLIGKVIDQITGLITNGLGGLNLTQFFSGFNGATTATDSLAYKISQAVSGGAATALGQVNTFFANLRSFLGGGSGFLSGTFDLKTTVENFISNVLKAPTIGINLVTTGLNNLLDRSLIPDLPIAKIENLTRFLTGSATAVAADLERFFTNLRGMFGGNTNLLGTTFNFADAANQFITNVLSKAGTGLSALIPEHALSALGIGKITNLIGFITGATGAAASNPDTLKNFFAGFAPFTGLNTIVNQITQSIFGTGGTLSQLQSFFSGLGGAFNPSTGAGNIVQQFVQQITGKVGGVLGDIGSFLGIGPVTDSTTFNPFTGANNLINQIVTKIVPAGTNLVDMSTFFTNLRNLFGTTSFLTGTFDFPAAARAFIDNVLSKVSAVTTKIPGLAIGNLAINQITNLIKNITGVDTNDNTALEKFFSGFSGFNISTGANNLINQFVAKITGNNGQALSSLTDFFNNLRNFLGFNPVSAGGSTSLGSAVNLFFDRLNNSGATSRLNPANVLSNIGMGQISDLIGFITNGVGTVAADVQSFFTNLRNTLGLNFLPSSGTFSASAAQKIVHDVIANINKDLSAGQKWATQAVADAKATISDIVQKITGTTGATNLDPIGNFFSGLLGSGGSLLSQFVSRITGTGSTLANLETTFANLRSFLGFSPLTTASPAAAINSFFGTLNANPPTFNTLELDLLAKDMGIEKVRDLANQITGSTTPTSAGVGTAFNNLRNFLGFNPASAGGSTTLGSAVNLFFDRLNNSGATGRLNPANVLSPIAVTQISNLVSALTGTGSTATDLSTFFTNLRSTFGGINFLPGTTFNASAAQRAIHDFVASINSNLAAGQKWATQAIADAKAGIADIVQRITGATGATDLSGIGNFFSGLLGSNGSLVSQFVSRITGGSTGTLADLTSTFTNLRDFLGFNPFGGFTNLTTAVGNFFAKLNTVTLASNLRIDPAKLLQTIGMDQIGNLITYLTGSSTGLVADVQSFFNNLRNFLGFNPVSTGSSSNLATAVGSFFTKLNSVTLASNLRIDPEKLLSDIGITKITNLVPFITGTGSVATDIQNFFNRLKSILGGVNPMSAASVAAEQSNLFTALNQASSGSLGTAKVAGVEGANIGSDLRGLLGSVVLGLQGNPSSTAAGGTTPRLSDLFSTAKNTSDSIANIAQVISELQTTATQAANSGNSDFTVFPNFALWNNGGLTYSGTASGNPGSAVEAINNQAVWKSYNGTTTRTARAVFTRTKTSTDYQRVGITFSSKPMGDWGGGASPAYNYILGRANNNSGVTTEYVFAKFSPTALSVGYTLNGGASETMFQTINHSFSPGATYWLECGTSGGQAVYRVLRGSEVLLTVTNTGFNAYTNADHRFGGFAMTGTWNNFWINEPGSMAAFAIADNTPATYLGSGFRRYRNASPQTISSIGTGNRFLPNDFFNTGDKITADYTYDPVGNKVTVSTEGWYQVNMNLALTTNTGTGAMQNEIAPLLYKNGVVDARGASAVGIGGLTARGPSQCAGAFQVYLKAGEYIQPGYWYSVVSGQSVTGTLTGDAAGHTCYLQVTFMNRSTTA